MDKLPAVINAYLPADIAVTAAQAVSDEFNPRFGAKHKTYTYTILNASHPNPLQARYSAFVSHSLDISAMQNAASNFIGKHDFAAFCATGGSAKTTVREIFDCKVVCEKNLITMTITGNAFLYNMVRIIAGTVLYAGLGKISPREIPQIIAAKDRSLAGKTMPPQGLTLVAVVY
jgi:tRNA pseudouridine38-40 synthase